MARTGSTHTGGREQEAHTLEGENKKLTCTLVRNSISHHFLLFRLHSLYSTGESPYQHLYTAWYELPSQDGMRTTKAFLTYLQPCCRQSQWGSHSKPPPPPPTHKWSTQFNRIKMYYIRTDTECLTPSAPRFTQSSPNVISSQVQINYYLESCSSNK